VINKTDIKCPACGENTISTLSLFRSVIGIGFYPECSACHTQWSVSSIWQGGYTGFILLSFVLSAVFSIKLHSYVPYYWLIVALFLAAYSVARFAKPMLRKPIPYWLQLLHYIFFGLLILILMKI
jgi:ssDNA-binding Zn-finger/Zn-ribbon topoisomerase 1